MKHTAMVASACFQALLYLRVGGVPSSGGVTPRPCKRLLPRMRWVFHPEKCLRY